MDKERKNYMAVSYNIVFNVEEATHWICFDEDEARELIPQKPYGLQKETAEGKTAYFIINEKGVKTYDAWKTRRGDYISV